MPLLLAATTSVIAGATLILSYGWPFKAALFPRVLSVPLLILSLIEVVACLMVEEKEQEGHAVDFSFTTDVDPALARRRTVAIFAWIVGFFVLILLIGFTLAVPVFVFLYLKFVGKEKWMLTLILTLISYVVMQGFFDNLLHLPFPSGILF